MLRLVPVSLVEQRAQNNEKMERENRKEIVQHWNTRIVFPEDVCLTTIVKTNESGFSCLFSALFSWVLSN